MKTLTLLRHAKSSWDDPVQRDFDRPLNKRGRKAARTVGRELKRVGLGWDRIIASPAVRVVETLADVSEGYGSELAPSYDRRIYLASAQALLELVQETDDTADRLMLVGHNPGLEMLALLLTRADEAGLRAEIEMKYPTATVTESALSAERWADVAEGSGTVSRFIRPRDLDPDLGPDEES